MGAAPDLRRPVHKFHDPPLLLQRRERESKLCYILRVKVNALHNEADGAPRVFRPYPVVDITWMCVVRRRSDEEPLPSWQKSTNICSGKKYFARDVIGIMGCIKDQNIAWLYPFMTEFLSERSFYKACAPTFKESVRINIFNF